MKGQKVSISRICTHEGCRRVATFARRVSDFWISLCDVHQGNRFTIDWDKIGKA